MVFIHGGIRKSVRGITHGGVRWKTSTCAVFGAISGISWIAEAPVPITATRLPARSTE